MSATLATQIRALAGRSVVRSLRQPATIVPAILFPLVFLAVTVGGLRAVTELPGFPTDNYLDFALAFIFLQGAMFAMLSSGQDLAKDIQTGFLNRLSLTPMRGAALLTGHLAGAATMGVLQAVAFIAVGLAAGATIAAGVAGGVLLVILALLISVGFASLGAMLALRVGSGEAVQGMFPLFFILLFFSSMSLPRNLIETGWFREVATYNPVSYLIEGMRSLIVTGWDAQALALGFGFAVALFVLGLASAAASLKTRLVRT